MPRLLLKQVKLYGTTPKTLDRSDLVVQDIRTPEMAIDWLIANLHINGCTIKNKGRRTLTDFLSADKNLHLLASVR